MDDIFAINPRMSKKNIGNIHRNNSTQNLINRILTLFESNNPFDTLES